MIENSEDKILNNNLLYYDYNKPCIGQIEFFKKRILL